MISLLGGIFRPREVKAVLLTLEIEGKILSQNASFGYTLVGPQLKRLILRNPNLIVEKVSTNGVPVNYLVVSLIRDFAFEELKSGYHHSYRGILCDSGTWIMTLWEAATERLIELGELTEEKADRHREVVREWIRDMG